MTDVATNTLLAEIGNCEAHLHALALCCAAMKGKDTSAIEAEMRVQETEMQLKTRQLLYPYKSWKQP